MCLSTPEFFCNQFYYVSRFARAFYLSNAVIDSSGKLPVVGLVRLTTEHHYRPCLAHVIAQRLLVQT